MNLMIQNYQVYINFFFLNFKCRIIFGDVFNVISDFENMTEPEILNIISVTIDEINSAFHKNSNTINNINEAFESLKTNVKTKQALVQFKLEANADIIKNILSVPEEPVEKSDDILCDDEIFNILKIKFPIQKLDDFNLLNKLLNKDDDKYKPENTNAMVSFLFQVIVQPIYFCKNDFRHHG